MAIIGGHVSAAGELSLSVQRAQDIGAQTFQFFISAPQQWIKGNYSDQEVAEFKKKLQDAGINQTFVHGTYLINLATAKPDHLEKSIDWLRSALYVASKLGATGVIFHTGSHGGRGFDTAVDQIANSLNEILSNQDTGPYIILENSAGGGGSIGSKFVELGAILKKTNNPRVKVCLDTCHAFAAGYDVRSPEGLTKTLIEFDNEIGLQNLVAIHANDTKFDIGSGKDRHENIGEGFIGKEGFRNMLNNEKLANVPFILEVPGFAGNGPDKENIDILQRLLIT